MMEERKKRVAYYFDDEVGLYTFNKGHPMRPFRMKITDELINVYGIKPAMQCFDADFFDLPTGIMTKYHSDEYIDLLKNIKEDNFHLYQDHVSRFGFSGDCPCPKDSKFYDFCELYTKGSILGARLINEGDVDIAINWCGGLHHAKRQEASGFCYVNDCVLAILELLKKHERVLYIDIDVHHGDGVEEAFFTSDRVLTCSFHKFKDFFPSTGNYTDIGYEKGIYRAVNFPFEEGVDDEMYFQIFQKVIDRIMEVFKPDAIVHQCGADSLSGDKLGCFNLSVKGHGRCLQYVKSFGKPIIALGGGGYTLRNIPRCWTYETSLLLDKDIPDEIPDNEYIGYFKPEKRLHLPISNMENQNSPEELHYILNKVDENIKKIKFSPQSYQIDGTGNHHSTVMHESNQLRREMEEEKSEPHRNDNNIIH